MRERLILVMIITLLAPAAASAQAPPRNLARGWYVGADAGLSRLHGEFRIDDDAVGFEDDSRVLSAHAGYRFNRFLSLGAFIADYGSFSVSSQGYSADANASSFGAQFVVRVPLGERFGVHGIAMACFDDLDFTARAPGGVFKDDGGGMNARFGIGLNYQVDRTLELRIDVQQTQDVNRGFLTFGGFPLSFDGDLTSVSLGLRYKFPR